MEIGWWSRWRASNREANVPCIPHYTTYKHMYVPCTSARRNSQSQDYFVQSIFSSVQCPTKSILAATYIHTYVHTVRR